MRILVAVVVVVGTVRVATAQYNVPSQASGDARTTQVIAVDDRPTVRKQPPLGWELGASLDFLTSDRSPFAVRELRGSQTLEFTDVVLFRVHALVALGKRAELFGGIDLLPKQPSYTDELVWQGALVGARFKLAHKFSAYLRTNGGPNLRRDGYWIGGEGALQSRTDVAEKVLFWESTLGGTYTQLFLDEPVAPPFRQVELLAQTGIAIREKKGVFATWLMFGFHFPLGSRPDRLLDPQTRVGVQFGMLFGVTKSLDFFLELSVLDRGDVEDVRTTLPMLSGGFDQNRVLFGFNRRFGVRRR